MGAFMDNLPRPPTKAERERDLAGVSRNPIKLFGLLTPIAHAQYFAGWFAWTSALCFRCLMTFS